jgi:hypothetical protein
MEKALSAPILRILRYRFFGGSMSVMVPSFTSAAKHIVSESVG